MVPISADIRSTDKWELNSCLPCLPLKTLRVIGEVRRLRCPFAFLVTLWWHGEVQAMHVPISAGQTLPMSFISPDCSHQNGWHSL